MAKRTRKTRKIQTADQVMALLRKRYDAPAWVFLEEVRNGTGYRSVVRTADGIAMGLWPSRGMEIHGVEVKVRRDDIVKELRNPEKAAAIMKYCDRWWLVLGDESLIEPNELPPTWGLMVVRGKTQLRVVVNAPQLEPSPLDRGFMASMLRNFEKKYVSRRAYETLQGDIDRQIHKGIEERVESALNAERKRRESRLSYLEQEVAKYRELMEEFQKRSGVHLAQYNLGSIVDAMQIVHSGNTDMQEARLRGLCKDLRRMHELAERSLERIEKSREAIR